MARFADLTARLRLDTSGLRNGLKSASASVQQFSTDMHEKIKNNMVAPIKDAKFQFKDVARIVQGILLSQVFYAGLGAIKQSINAVWEFSKSLEYADMIYSNLFGSTALAQEFINVLKDFSAITPFSFSEAEAASKRLLAYGIQYQNVMYVMQGVLAASTVQNKPEAIEPISRALGQIYTKGKLMNEELRQLAEAGIPVYDILREKLGLTSEQIAEIGDQAIPASTAINALVDGINERFGSSLAQSAQTTTGIISNIKDNALMLFSGIFTPLFDQIHDALAIVGDGMDKLRAAFDIGGIGGVFEALIPPEFRNEVKLLIVNLMSLWSVLKTGLTLGMQILGQMIVPIMRALNAVLPIINAVTGTVISLLSMLASNTQIVQVLTTMVLAAAGAWMMYKTQMLLAALVTTLVKGMSTVIGGLGTALSWIALHPVWAVFALGIGLLIALTGASERLRASIAGLYGSFLSLGGVDYKQILMPETKQRAADLTKFNQALDTTNDNMSNLADSTGNAAKAAKSLFAFDEVFKLTNPDETGGETVPGIEVPKVPDIGLPEVTTPETPDFTEYVGNIWESLKNALLGKNFFQLINDFFWGPLKDAFGWSNMQTIAVEFLTGFGAVLGGIGTGIIKLLGAAGWADIKFAVAAIVREFMEGGFKDGMAGIGAVFKAGIEDVGLFTALKNGFKGLLKGAIVGAIVDLVVGTIAAQWAEKIREIFKLSPSALENAGWGQLILGTLGGIIGGLVGGPLGAIIGIAIGDLVGSVLGVFWDRTVTELAAIPAGWWKMITDAWTFDDKESMAERIFDWLKASFAVAFSAVLVPLQILWTGLLKPLIDGIGALFGVDVTGTIASFFANFGTNVENFRNTTGPAIMGWCEETGTAFVNWRAGVGETIMGWCNDAGTAFVNWRDGVNLGFTTFFLNVWTGFTTFFTNVSTGLVTFLTTAWTNITTWCTNTFTGFTTWMTNLWTGFTTFFTNIGTGLITFLTTAWTNITTWITNTFTSFTTWFANNATGFTNFFSNILGQLGGWIGGTIGAIGGWIGSTGGQFSGWFGSIIGGFAGWAGSVLGTIGSWIAQAAGAFSGWCGQLSGMFNGWWAGVINGFYNFGAGIYNAIAGWIGQAASLVQGLVDTAQAAVSAISSVFSSSSSGSYSVTSSLGSSAGIGHATGGVFNREHMANFAEGNKAEAIIPLENNSAMQPFVDAVANGLTAVLAPMMAGNSNNQEQKQPLYVGTLIADDKGLKELNRKMQVIQLAEDARKG